MSEKRKTLGHRAHIPGNVAPIPYHTPTITEMDEELKNLIKEFNGISKKLSTDKTKRTKDFLLERILSMCSSILSRANARNQLNCKIAKQTEAIFKEYKNKQFSSEEAKKRIYQTGLGFQIYQLESLLSRER